jgi:hypothetical protein
VELRRRWHADLARPEMPTSRNERLFLLGCALVIVVAAQLTDPGSARDLLVLMPAVVAFGLPRLPPELFSLLVVVPVSVAVGRGGTIEGSFFLAVMMVYATASHSGR